MTSDTDSNNASLADDLLIGADAIATELGMTKYMVYRSYRENLLPISKFGKALVASRSKLRQAVQQMT